MPGSTDITHRRQIDESLAAHARKGRPCVLLESNRRDPENQRSLLFAGPVDVLRFHAGDDVGDFFAALDERLESGLWAAGYFAYEFGHALEPRLAPLLARSDRAEPLAWLGLFDGPLLTESADAPRDELGDDDEAGVTNLRLNLTRDAYDEAFAKIQRHIADGDTYQVNFTFKYRFDCIGAPDALYRRLRHRQRVSWGACLDDGERSILSLSPEMFFRTEGGDLVAQPMKGTAPRGATAEEDARVEAWLRADPKNRAENVMIVDMIRNDLGRISPPGRVHTENFLDVERYETLFQMISRVRATPRPGLTWREAITALFPCASVTGAPKIRTMELISELEKEPRGVYTGSIGYFAPDGSAAFNVAIRTLVIDRNGHGEMGVGSGVVFDSDAPHEYEECLLKARFVTGVRDDFSLVETMLVEDKSIHLFDLHMERLERSVSHFDFRIPSQLRETLRSRAAGCGKGRSRMRLLLDRDGRFEISVEELPVPPGQPLRFALYGEHTRSNDPFLLHKTTHRPLYARARDEAGASDLDEVVFCNEKGEVTEGTISNVFVVVDGRMWTPPLASGVLPGTLRRHLMSTGKCGERTLHPADLTGADRIFLGNSVMGLVEARMQTLPAMPWAGRSQNASREARPSRHRQRPSS